MLKKKREAVEAQQTGRQWIREAVEAQQTGRQRPSYRRDGLLLPQK